MSATLGREVLRAIRGDDMRTAVAELMDGGWRAVRWTGRGMLLLEHPSGGRVTAASRPSDRHAVATLRRLARNALAARWGRKS